MQIRIVDWPRNIGQGVDEDAQGLTAAQRRPDTGVVRHNRSQFPAAGNRVSQAAVIQERLSLAKRQFVNGINAEHVVDVLLAVATIETHIKRMPGEDILPRPAKALGEGIRAE